MKRLLGAALACLVLLASCGDPNVWSHLGYDPVKSLGTPEALQTTAGQDFDLLSITRADLGFEITYKPEESGLVLKQLDPGDLQVLVETVRYLDLTGRLEETLEAPLDSGTREILRGTLALTEDICGSVGELVGTAAEALASLGVEVDPGSVENIFTELGDALSGLDTTTVESYIAIQLSTDMVASAIEMIGEIAGAGQGAGSVAWESLRDLDFSADGSVYLEAISGNATHFTALLLESVAAIDLIGSRIPGFVDLSTAVGALF